MLKFYQNTHFKFQEINTSNRDLVRAIISHVRKGPWSHFEKLCLALEETNQGYIVEKMLGKGKKRGCLITILK